MNWTLTITVKKTKRNNTTMCTACMECKKKQYSSRFYFNIIVLGFIYIHAKLQLRGTKCLSAKPRTDR